jgi:Uncharacterized protein conserved in bacteria
MQTYIAMLRGINVSGHKIIRMEHLRACFANLGFRNVKTYVQSGNVIFETHKDSAACLCEKIEKCILREFGFSVPVLLKTTKELQQIVRDNPFSKKPSIDPSKLHVTFLSKQAPKTAPAGLELLITNAEQFRVSGEEVYLYCPNGYGKTKLSNTAIPKNWASERPPEIGNPSMPFSRWLS